MNDAVPDFSYLYFAVAAPVMVAAIIAFVLSIFRINGATKASVALVEANSEAMRLLGSPLQLGWAIFGNIRYGLFSSLIGLVGLGPKSTGFASISIPLRGPLAYGRARVKLDKINGKWVPYSGRITINSRIIPLIDVPSKGSWFIF